VVETDMESQVDADIIQSMRMTVCRMKADLTSAFVQAQHEQHVQLLGDSKKRFQSGRFVNQSFLRCADTDSGAESEVSPALISQRSEKGVSHVAFHLLEYDRWLAVLSSVMPEYQVILPTYAPRLLATSTMEGAELTVKGRPVNFMRWLDRFQVTIAYENYDDFKRDILQRVFKQIKAKSSHMSLSDVLSYFDPNDDGTMRITDVAFVLRKLNLGLPERQLQQLVYELGFVDSAEEVEPVKVLALLLNGLSNFQKGAISSGKNGDPNSSPGQAPKLEAVRNLLQANKSLVSKALGGESMAHLFSRADSDDGNLSYEEAKHVLVKLIEVCGGTSEVRLVDLDELVRTIDFDGDGTVTFMEFVAAFGLTEPSLCFSGGVDTDAEDITSHLAEGIIQQICSALYDRSHALQKAFIYLDEEGGGWLPVADFENALLLVLSGSGSEADKARQVMMAPQIKDLVVSLKRSHMANPNKDTSEIDYMLFIQSFRVIDSVLEV